MSSVITEIKKKSVRDSNLEALRIVAMMLVLLHHCMFLALYFPGTDYPEQTITAFGIMEPFTLVCVNLFVMISGYFGIRPTLRGLCKLLFIVYFWRYSIYGFSVIIGQSSFSANYLVYMLNPFDGEWFVSAYLGLYFFAIFINTFIEKATKTQFKTVLIIFLVIGLLNGWLLGPGDKAIDFRYGYSTLSLMLIYIIGRYIHKYHREIPLSKTKLLLIYIGASILNATTFIYFQHYTTKEMFISFVDDPYTSYDNGFTIVATVALFYIFTKLHFQNRLVNWLGASAFSVYLIHCNSNILFKFLHCANQIFVDFWPWLWLPVILVFISCVYLGCTLIDQVRIYIWKQIDATMQKHNLW